MTAAAGAGAAGSGDAPDVVFFDIGGVLLSNGWDHEQRAEVLEHFRLDRAVFEERHHNVVGDLEAGRLSLDDYLQQTVLADGPPDLTPQAFTDAIFALSTPNEEALALARALSAGGIRLYALNNESRELNRFRVQKFRLGELLLAFFTSSTLGLTKPNPAIYRAALELAQVEPARAVMVDDREQNVAAARRVGMRGIVHTDAASTAAALRALGLRWEG